MTNEHTEYSGEVDVPVEAIQAVDPNVVAAHGASFWTRTARLDAELDGEHKEYFLKTSYGDRGRSMMSGEFCSMSTIYAATPDFVPRPIAWGTYATIPDVHFLLCDFREMTDDLPDLKSFPVKLAELHRKGTSPDGKYGFSVTTYHGNTPLNHGWSDTWEEYFTRTTRVLFLLEREAQGPNAEIDALIEPFFEKVVPRLLRPLETGGRKIKPSLIHGDLWHGNATTDADTNLPIIFDAASFYAHNEYDLGVWRATWNKIGKPYMVRYHKHFPISPPEADHDDRNALYATLISGMRELVEKFPDGLKGWEEA
ncbi:hypothetical protein GP486_000417 [Trichoglossum hirsutum]|uniref:protein-ribulosamine 3-kinase n=1 Tax=Trichoglossum hirsutum TaxID=265104 RepID=A0A9P8LHU4_9PEZI|nr:hypothetical protein GP486_000417 [Trichoglossum hirsutum]